MAKDDEGYIKLYRRFFKRHRFWLEPVKFHRREAWIDMIQYAAFLPYTRVIDKEPIPLERAELVGSLRFFADRWFWSLKEVRGFFGNLERNHEIRAQRRAQAGTVYLIVKYDEYQDAITSAGIGKGKPRAQQGHKVEVSSNEVIKETDILFDLTWLEYPKKIGKQDAYEAWNARIAEKNDPKTLADGIRRYIAHEKANHTELKYYKNFATFLNKKKKFWLEPWTIELRVLPQAVNGPPRFDYSKPTQKFKGFPP